MNDARTCRGASLLETVAAIGIATAMLAAAAAQIRHSARSLATARELSQAVTIARNVLDHALAAACAPSVRAKQRCRPGWVCDISVVTLGTRQRQGELLTIERVVVRVARGLRASPPASPAVGFVTVRARTQACS